MRIVVAFVLASCAIATTVVAEVRPPIGVAAGQMYPDFLLPTIDGEVKRFSDYRGKKILLFHFASW